MVTYEMTEREIFHLRVYGTMMAARLDFAPDRAFFAAVQHYLEICHYMKTTHPQLLSAMLEEDRIQLALCVMLRKRFGGGTTEHVFEAVLVALTEQHKVANVAEVPFEFFEWLDTSDMTKPPTCRLRCTMSPHGTYIMAAPTPFQDVDSRVSLDGPDDLT